MRLAYVVLSPDGEDIAAAVVRDGAEFNKLQSANIPGRQLRDRQVVEWLSAIAPWVRPLYLDTNDFVHLSDRAVSHVIGAPDAAGKVSVSYRAVETNWPAASRVETLSHGAAITRGVIEMLRFQRTGGLIMSGDHFGAPDER